MSVSYKFTQRHDLAALCILDGADERYITIEAKANLDVDALFRTNEKMFQQISTDIERGYRVTTDPVLVRIENTFLKHCRAKWEMSYFGKAEIDIFIRDESKARQVRADAKALIELMGVDVRESWDGFNYSLRSTTTTETKEDARGRRRKVPVINHQFQQLRPLLLPVLEEQKETRISVRQAWASRPVVPLYWR